MINFGYVKNTILDFCLKIFLLNHRPKDSQSNIMPSPGNIGLFLRRSSSTDAEAFSTRERYPNHQYYNVFVQFGVDDPNRLQK